ncbi:MAG: hypothetical protein PHI55_05785, partial [Burkholderiaceae bacterium]|nr:hypothetical protein [Burkholderiaceae bacterium]
MMDSNQTARSLPARHWAARVQARIAIILLTAAGCGAKKAHPVIGVVQLAEHIALDQSFEGFQKAL